MAFCIRHSYHWPIVKAFGLSVFSANFRSSTFEVRLSTGCEICSARTTGTILAHLRQLFTCYTVMQKYRVSHKDCPRQRLLLRATSRLRSSTCHAPKTSNPVFSRIVGRILFKLSGPRVVESTVEWRKKRPIIVFRKKSRSREVHFWFWGSDPQTVSPSHIWPGHIVGTVERYRTAKTPRRYLNGLRRYGGPNIFV